MKFVRFLSWCLVFLLSAYFFTACKAGRPARATLPDQSENREFTENQRGNPDKQEGGGYSIPGLPFYAVDTSIEGKNFTAIYLRNPEFDSLAFGIIKSYEPFANSLLKMVTEQGIKGVLIDFRRNDDDRKGEARFSVANHNEQTLTKTEPLNIVFLWDELSASRAAGFMNELNTSPAVAVKTISSTDATSTPYRQDCFRPGLANFEGQ